MNRLMEWDIEVGSLSILLVTGIVSRVWLRSRAVPLEVGRCSFDVTMAMLLLQ